MALPQEKFNQPPLPPPDLTKEYVVGSGFWSARIAQILSNFLYDDLESLIGCDVYERMARDPVVSKNLQFQKLSVTSEGVQLHLPKSVGKEGPEFDLANEIKDFHQRGLEGLHRPITQIIGEMLVALKRGHSVAEITYNEPATTGVDAYKLTLKSIKVKPRNTTAFVVDPFRNVLGLTAWSYGMQGTVPSSQMAPGQNIIPLEKFAVLAFETEDEDPRGINPLRAVFNFWEAKCLVVPLYLKWLEKSYLPSTVGTTPPEAGYEQPRDENDQPLTDAAGNPKVMSAEELMADRLAQLSSGASAAFPYGSTIKSIEVSSTGAQFTRALLDIDTQIDYGIVLQSGATKDSKSGSYASKRIFKDVLDILIWSRKHSVAQVIQGVLKNGTRYNFGDENVHLTPVVMIGDEEGRDWARDAAAVAAIAPYLTDSQWDELCAEMGIAAPQEGETRPSRAKPAPVMHTGTPDNNPAAPLNQPGEGAPPQ